MEIFSSGKADRVELLYHHFKNMATQVLTHKVYLPVTLPQASVENTVPTTDYILEPSPESLQALLFEAAQLNDLHDITRHNDIRACRPHDGDANGQRQCQRPDPGIDLAI